MQSIINLEGVSWKVDLNNPLDISIALRGGENNLTAWYQNPPVIEPVRDENFIGSVQEGGVVNFRNIFFNPHAHCTHTECVGHISKEEINLGEVLKTYFFSCQVVTIEPTTMENGDHVIELKQVQNIELSSHTKSLVIRTIPNTEDKKGRQYSNTNPPYIDPLAMNFLREKGILHFLTDLPSVDREEDEGALSAHRAFWNYPAEIDRKRTITEFIYVNESISDGAYLLELQTANFSNDASPSRPILYAVEN